MTKVLVTGMGGELGTRVAQLLEQKTWATEIVGVPPQRFMPPADARATRLLKEPGRSLENALQEAGL